MVKDSYVSASERWYGAVPDDSADIPWGLGPNATYFNSPGSVENYLSWIGATSAGNRGIPMTAESPAEFTITGEEEVLKNLSHYFALSPKMAMDRLKLNAEYILSESEKEVPWDSTHLQQTGTVEPFPEGDGFRIGYNTPYAERQHEDMTFHHPKPGTKAKYLEDPAMRIVPTIAEDIAEHLRSVFG